MNTNTRHLSARSPEPEPASTEQPRTAAHTGPTTQSAQSGHLLEVLQGQILRLHRSAIDAMDLAGLPDGHGLEAEINSLFESLHAALAQLPDQAPRGNKLLTETDAPIRVNHHRRIGAWRRCDFGRRPTGRTASVPSPADDTVLKEEGKKLPYRVLTATEMVKLKSLIDNGPSV